MGTGCVQPEEIDALLAGELAAAEIERVEAHLDGCRDCRVLVGQLAKDSQFVALGSSDTQTPGPDRDADVTADTIAGTDPPPAPAPRPSARLRPMRIGRYLVERKLGAGGMGVVYLADDPELRRKVVIKLLRAAAAAQPADRARLLREAQAMAQVSHPNVVPIYDVGVHGDQVFLAMEFVDGSDLAGWLRTPRGVREVLEVFAAAGRGLAAAHRAGLVHRDFKPHNVMIATTGEVKVTDFGLARAEVAPGDAPGDAPDPAPRLARTLSAARARELAHAPLLESSLTHTGALVGTPAYMAPEQILGDPVDARTDQFSFCVALYEALYGERPFRGGTMSELFDSTLEGLDERRLTAVARRRRIPARVRSALRRGLAADPAARFPAMGALIAELAPPVRRRAIVAAVALGAAAVAGSTAAIIALTRDPPGADPAALCTGGAGELAGVWSPARRQTVEAGLAAAGPTAARVVPSVIAGVDRYATAWLAGHRGACEATRVRGEQTEDAMDLRMRCLRRRRGELDALLDVLATPDRKLLATAAAAVAGLASPAVCDDIESLGASLGAAAPVAELGRRFQLDALEGELAAARAQSAVQRLDAALAILTSAKARAEPLGHKPLLAELELELGLVQVQANRWDVAEAHLHRAVEIAEEAGVDRVRALAFTALVSVASTAARFDEGDRWARYAQATIERLGSDRRLLGELDLRLAEAHRARGNGADAEAAARRAIDRMTAAHGPKSREAALARRELAMSFLLVNQTEKAFDELQRSHEALVEVFGAESPEVAVAIGLMGQVRYDQQRYEEAFALGRQELDMLIRVVGEHDPLTAGAYQAQALKLQGVQRPDEAIAMMAKAVAGMGAHFGERHPLYAGTVASLALIYANLGRHDDAYATWARALDIYVAAYRTDAHTDVTTLLNAMGTMRRRQGRYDEAAALYERARAALAAFQQPDAKQMADVLTRIGMLEQGRKRYADAIRVLEQALASRVAARAAPTLMSWTKQELAQALWEDGRDRPRALALAREARADALLDHDTAQVELIDRWLAGR